MSLLFYCKLVFIIISATLLLLFVSIPSQSAEDQEIQAKNESNLIDWEISEAFNHLFANFDLIDKQISLENVTHWKIHPKPTTIHPNTTPQLNTTTIHSTIHPKSTVSSKECGAKVTALTTIELESPFMQLRYWLLKPKLGLLRTLTRTSINEFGSYREIVTRKNQYMVIAYEFPEAQKINCGKLVEFSKNIVAYGSGEIPKIIVNCDCDKTFYFKTT